MRSSACGKGDEMSIRQLVRKTLLKAYGVSDEELDEERRALDERIRAREHERKSAEEEARQRYIDMRMGR